MNLGIQIGENFIELYENTSITFEITNAVFTDASGDIGGSYTFPFSVPVSANNKKIFFFAHNSQSNVGFISIQNCSVISAGLKFVGSLFLLEADDENYKIQIIISPIFDFRNTKLSDIDMGGAFLGSSKIVRENFYMEVARNPLDHDFCFFPVYNNGFSGLVNPQTPYYRLLFQNLYSYADEKLYEGENGTPFIRLSKVLKSIFKDFVFKNLFQTDSELNLLYLYNNYSIETNDVNYEYDSSISFQNHVPENLVPDFLKQLQFTFALGLFRNFEGTEVTIVPLRDIITNAAAHDWSKKAAAEYTIQPFENGISSFEFEKSGLDALENDYVDIPESEIYEWVGDRTQIQTTNFTGIENLYVVAKNPTDFVLRLESKKFVGDGKPFKSKLQKMEMIDYASPANIPNITRMGLNNYSACFVKGSRWDEPKRPKCPMKLMFYRGFSKDEQGGDIMPFPYSSSNNYDFGGRKSFKYSLTWEREGGLYETWHQSWHEITRKGSLYITKINLNTVELKNLNLYETIVINSVKYFIKSMKITVTNQEGLLPVEVVFIKL